MPATVTTTEKFPQNTSKKKRDAAIRLRIKAGAIRSKFTTPKWTLVTEWNVIGSNS